MTGLSQRSTTFVIGGHVIQARTDRSSVPRSMVVIVEFDYDRSWSFEEPGWQDIAFGVSDGRMYWWSARRLVIMPTDMEREPVSLSSDEDLRFVFGIGEDWIFVCETSVRLIVDGQEVSRLEFGEVLHAARWEASQLVIRDANGHDLRVVVADGELAI